MLKAENSIAFTVNLLTSLGYFLSIQKNTFSPQVEMIFLRVGVSPHRRSYFIPDEKEQKLRRLAEDIIAKTHITVKAVQQWAGFLNCLALVLPHTRFWLSPFFASINGKREQELIDVTPLINESALHWLRRDPSKQYLRWCNQSAETLQLEIQFSENGVWSAKSVHGGQHLLKSTSTAEFVE